MTKAIRIHTNGGPEVMKWEDVPTPEPGPGEALIKQEAVGLNYIDVYFRTGLYKAPGMPLIIGQEGAGTVVSVGPNCQPGEAGRPRRLCRRDRRLRHRAHASPPTGWSSCRTAIDFKTAAAMMLQGMTAQYLRAGAPIT